MKLILVHGIRTSTPWFHKLQESPELEKRGVKLLPFQYGYLTLLGFLLPLRRNKIIEDFLTFYEKNVEKGERPSVVAHSFGTWIVTSAITMYPAIRFDKMILLGSILNPDTDLDVFFGKDQVRLLRHEVGKKDWVVPLSRIILGPEAGKSGKVGFSIIPARYRKRVIQETFSKFSHGSAIFLQRHMEENWIPFLIKRPFNLKSSILREELWDWINYPALPDGVSFVRRDFYSRVDRGGRYYARYSLVIRNDSDQRLTRIPISISADCADHLKDMAFCPLDDTLAPVAHEVIEDGYHHQSINVQMPVLQPGHQQSLHYAFKLSQTIDYDGDFDHYDIRRTGEVAVQFHSFYRLVTLRFFAVRGGELTAEVEYREERQPDKTWKYCTNYINDKNDDSLILYFEGYHAERHIEKYRFTTNVSYPVDETHYVIRNAVERDLAKIEALELLVEGCENRALGGTIIERFRMFPDGFLVIAHKRSIVGYIESLIWKHRDFETFDDIRDFPLHHDVTEKELYVIFIAVSALDRGKGLGGKLLDALEDVAKRYQIERITLVAKSELKDFYEKRGYRGVKRLPHFLETVEGIYMEKTLR